VSQPYNPRVVVEKTPPALLQGFFSKFSGFADLDWASLSDDPEPVLQRLTKLNEQESRQVAMRLRQVHALSEPAGTKALIESAYDLNPDVASKLALMENGYVRAFWCLVECPQLLDNERIYAYTHSLRADSRESRVGFPSGKIIVTQAMLNDVVACIKTAYQDEHRADVCRLDHRESEGIHLFHAYPSDYMDEIDTYGPDDHLSSVRIKPPFHIVCYVDEQAGTITLFAKGGSEKHEVLFKGFATSILHAPTPPKAGKKTYDLSLFKNPNYELETDLAHHLTRPRVVSMRIQFPDQRQHRITFDVDPNDSRDSIYEIIRTKLRGGFAELSRATILSVELQAVFATPNRAEEVIRFKITAPRWCTLDYDGKEGLRKYLRLWGIENDGKRLAASPAASGV